ncbi:MAG: hypothetical protein GXY33_16735 [Phycisphaerae bacterium]|nr:hypothetical protein [Phycisphaerae bacterium]
MHTRPTRFTVAVLALTALASLAGCQQQLGRQGDWQIVLKRFVGPDRTRSAQWFHDSLKVSRGIDPAKIAVTHSDEVTLLTYGSYNNPQSQQAQKDLAFIKGLGVRDQGYLFLDAHLEPIPEPDPPILASWRLINSGGYWTLEIARFDEPGHKKAAVELVQYLRTEKKTPAYVYHAANRSLVTVGAFPEDAIQAGGGRRGPVIGMKPVVTDPDLKRWQNEFPYLIVNGTYIDLKAPKDDKKEIRMPSKIMRVPDPSGSNW